jgi:hypothetical protein
MEDEMISTLHILGFLIDVQEGHKRRRRAHSSLSVLLVERGALEIWR